MTASVWSLEILWQFSVRFYSFWKPYSECLIHTIRDKLGGGSQNFHPNIRNNTTQTLTSTFFQGSDKSECVRLCVCEREWGSVCVWVYQCGSEGVCWCCVCMCVCTRTPAWQQYHCWWLWEGEKLLEWHKLLITLLCSEKNKKLEVVSANSIFKQIIVGFPML